MMERRGGDTATGRRGRLRLFLASGAIVFGWCRVSFGRFIFVSTFCLRLARGSSFLCDSVDMIVSFVPDL